MMFRIILMLLACSFSSPLLAREWKISGKIIKADFIKLDGRKVVIGKMGRTRAVPVYELGYKDMEFVTGKYIDHLTKTRTDLDTDEIEEEARAKISEIIYYHLQEENVWLKIGTETCASVQGGVKQCSSTYRDLYRPALDYYDIYRPFGLGKEPQDIKWVRARYERGLGSSVEKLRR